MPRPQEAVICFDLDDFNWTDLKQYRDWLEDYDNLEARTLVQFINELWINDFELHWSMMWQQKEWLASVDDEIAGRLLHFIEVFQDKAMDTEQFTPEDVYGWHNLHNTSPLQPCKPNHLKLVVSNYFRPMERIDQPCKPDPVLTLV
jgi:hypothetical protein